MADTRMIDGAAEHEAVWELIPWHVSGALARGEAARVEAHAGTCPDCAAEIERQVGVAAGICMLEDAQVEAARDRSWRSLRARIEAEERARTPVGAPDRAPVRGAVRTPARMSPDGAAPLRGAGSAPSRGWRMPRFAGGLALGGALAAMVAVAVVTIQPADDGFQTLTQSPAGAAPEVQFQATAGTPRAVLEALAAAQGLTLGATPSEGGVWHATAAPGADAAELARLAEALMAAPEIIFAAPGKAAAPAPGTRP